MMVSPAARPTSFTDWVRWSELRVVLSTCMLAFWFWATAQMAPLSLADETF